MKKLLSLVIILGFMFACTSVFMFFATIMVSEIANSTPDGSVFWGQNITLEKDEVINDDVVMFGSNLTMAKDSTIDGDLAIFGGNAQIDGTVTGEIVVTGGNVNLGEHGSVGGDVGVVGGQFTQAPNSTVMGEVHVAGGDDPSRSYAHKRDNKESKDNQSRDKEKGFTAPEPPQAPEPPSFNGRDGHGDWDWDNDYQREDYSSSSKGVFSSIFSFIWGIVETITLVITLLVISWLVAALMPEQMKLVGDTALENNVLSFGVGLATLIVMSIVGVVLAITICLSPLSVLGWFIVSVALLFGLVAMAQIVGERLLVALDRPFPNFTTSTMVGTVTLALLFKMPIVGAIPCLGWLLHFVGIVLVSVITLMGLGAVILSRFGTQPHGKPFDYGSFNFGSWSSRPRTSWPDPDLDIKEDPKGPKVDLDKE